MLTKEKVNEAIKILPEEFSIDQLIEKIIVLQKINRGLEDSDSKNTFSIDQSKEKLRKWLK